MNKIKNIITTVQNYRYHDMHKNKALTILSEVEKTKGKLADSIKQQCDKYAIEKLGDIKYAPWLYVYSIIRGEFKEGWIPDNYYGKVVLPKCNGISGTPAQIKNITSKLFNSHLFPDLVCYSSGIFSIPLENRVLATDEIADYLFDGRDSVIFKVNSSNQGRGIFFYTKDNFSIADVMKKGSGIFQKIIKQHAVFDELFPKPGATMRLTTVLKPDGTTCLKAAYLRLGVGTDEYVRSATNIRVAIDIETGALSDKGYTTEWNEINEHPNTKKAFKGVILPNFAQARESVEELHSRYPYVQSIGWDVTINTDNNVEIMEWNAIHNSITFTEAVQGPSFTDLPWCDKSFLSL